MVSFPTEDVLNLCVYYGRVIGQPAGLDGRQLMAAIASNESSLGKDCGPRYEPSYDVGGRNVNAVQAALLKRYGKEAAMSYTPWQLMFINCPDYSPTELNNDAVIGARCFVNYFNHYVMHFDPRNLSQIAQIYNGGHIFSEIPAGVQTYINRLQVAYDTIKLPTAQTV